jgi:site-specific DNA recombinase
MEQPLRLRAVGYRRVSSKEQTDGHSLDAQEVHIRNYAQTQNWDIVHIYCDAGISAKKDSRRPALEQLMTDASQGKFDVVIVDKIDRFYRHLGGLLVALDALNGHGVAFASVQEHLDFTSPWGKLMLTVLGMLAEIYIDNLRQETKKGKLQRAREGMWNGSIPFGYCNGLCSSCTDLNGPNYCPEVGNSNKGDGKGIIPHPIESQAVRMAFQLYTTGEYSDGKLAEYLNNYVFTSEKGETIHFRTKGTPNRLIPGPMAKDNIRGILLRIFYTGKIAYYGTKENGTKRRRKELLELYDGKHPALISEEQFKDVQEIRAALYKNTREQEGVPVRLYPLSGMIRCGVCGSPFRGVTSNRGKRYYRDAAQIEKKLVCSQPMVNADEIEKKVVDSLKNILDELNPEDDIRAIQEAIEQVEQRFDRAKFLFLNDMITKEEFEKEIEKKDSKLNSLRTVDNNAIMALHNLVRQTLVEWDRTLPTERKRLLRLVVEVVFLRGSSILAFQPTLAFLPFLRGKKGSCNSGSDGVRTRDLGLDRAAC